MQKLDGDLIAAAPVFAALGDPTRLSLFKTLSDGRARSITELADGALVTRQAVTKHLKTLAEAGLVDGEWRGRENRFALRRDGLDHAQRLLDEVSAQWDDALDRLKAFVEEKTD